VTPPSPIQTATPPPPPARARSAGRAVLAAAPPAGYVPVRHPGRPHRGDRESIQNALRHWVEQTGRAPRRHDWSGEHSDAAAPA
jgi:hypothetical protein